MYRRWFYLVTLAFVIPIPFLSMDLWLRRPEWLPHPVRLRSFWWESFSSNNLACFRTSTSRMPNERAGGNPCSSSPKSIADLRSEAFGLPYSERASGPTVTSWLGYSFSQPSHNIECERTVGLHSLATAAQRYLQEETEAFCYATSKHLLRIRI